MKKTSEKITKLSLLAAVLFVGHVASADNAVASEQSKGTAQAAAGKAEAAAGKAQAAAGDAQVIAGKAAQAVAAKAQGAVVKTIAAKPAAMKAPAKKPVAAKPVAKPAVVTAVAPVVAAPVVVASVAPAAPVVTLKVTGAFAPEIGIISNENLANKDNLSGYNFGWNALKMNFTPSVKTENGVVFSGTARLDLTTDTGSRISDTSTPAKPLGSLIPQVTRLHATISHEKIGKINVGNNYGLQVLSQKGHQDILNGAEGFDRTNQPQKYVTLSDGSYKGDTLSYFDTADSGRAQKISISTASFAGFSLGATFTPRNDIVGSNTDYPLSVDKAGVKNMWFIVPTFDQKFGDFKVGVMGAFGMGTAVDKDGKAYATGSEKEDPKMWHASTTLSYMGFDIGGGYTDAGTSLLTKAQTDLKMSQGKGWHVAGGYTYGSFRLAVEYMATSKAWGGTDDDKVSADCFTGYLGYTVTPGVTLYLSENYVTSTAAKAGSAGAKAITDNLGTNTKNQKDAKGNVFFVGMDIQF